MGRENYSRVLQLLTACVRVGAHKDDVGTELAVASRGVVGLQHSSDQSSKVICRGPHRPTFLRTNTTSNRRPANGAAHLPGELEGAELLGVEVLELQRREEVCQTLVKVADLPALAADHSNRQKLCGRSTIPRSPGSCQAWHLRPCAAPGQGETSHHFGGCDKRSKYFKN